ncbi:hypothetical protein EYF80_044621 [Liparis tanakae]|uniref:Uncharacterized protein n=1 Tax=Liparis tanakae TaxID=230148 RepID=A0A4Z2FW20_9TELE|nr:hypothetical protein EYF80_044621 [Liparis tanakae]
MLWKHGFGASSEFCNSSERRLHLSRAFRSDCSAASRAESYRENVELSGSDHQAEPGVGDLVADPGPAQTRVELSGTETAQHALGQEQPENKTAEEIFARSSRNKEACLRRSTSREDEARDKRTGRFQGPLDLEGALMPRSTSHDEPPPLRPGQVLT